MLLGFQQRFVPYVMEGSKTPTIRGPRRSEPRVGEICHCYADTRRASMRLLGRWPCVKVERILIDARFISIAATHIDIRINDIPLGWDERINSPGGMGSGTSSPNMRSFA